MAIDSITGRVNNLTTLKTAPKVELDATKKPTVNNTEKTDSVALTTATQEIKKTFEASSAQTPVDSDKVAAIKKALADGTYKINAEQIAKKIIQFEGLKPQDDST
ncbi:MAG: flagellar biosynthesis anti-sigma factor FlgM [Methylococcaceae bacterium]|jgi:negative regulator of flagellin synthesis FlgM|nr:flagellar biosynthesis anti-sigma factor FlgM [Methylococcaceae bacterium]MDZ4156976.1 flagellar biosynthesis anti-sigma factor FlgM [Methylococcales bacterium]MDP2392695.1 flagellar biosynthesis anti-sigma factor FlgM [Methylococcaceae bacterium]MDP3018560.1 flagellar biosynthesis anti-sigma factor FlgM [Methylococcaceae bacterium]MDP3391315.1 flagellar biosynthesis anti-sigma factor FlgM [Methylococcaceae bacterium]